MAESDAFVQRLQYVLQFLSEHGFEKAATAVYEQLESKTDEPSQSAPDLAAEAQVTCPGDEYRSVSADPVLEGSRGASEAGEELEDSQAQSPWLPGVADALQTRLSGSSRLYEDPDVDEYGSMEDVGYVRRSISNQQEFVMSQLDFLRTNDDECYFHSSSAHQGDSRASCSNSSSASLSSPGLSSCTGTQQQPTHADQQHEQQEQSPDGATSGQNGAAATGDAAWDSGPAGITFAEPVTTPTKGSQRSSISDLKPSLSRVESLSNSFIEEFESVDGGPGGAEALSRQDSGADSIADDLGTPPRSSRAGAGSSCAGDGAPGQGQNASCAVIDLSPPSPPPDCAADAGIDLSNIFELGLRASSRTSSVDVLQGSVRCWSEPDSDTLFGQQQQLDTGRIWPQSAAASASGSNASSRAGSSLGTASFGGPGGLIIKPRQSAGASRLQSSSQHDPEQEVQLGSGAPQQQPPLPLLLQQPQEQEQPQQCGQQQDVEQPEQAALAANQQLQEQRQQEQHAGDSVLVLSPTHEQQQQQQACAFVGHGSKQQQQQLQEQEQRPVNVSDSGSSSSTAGPVTPTGALAAPAAAAAAAAGGSDSSAAEAEVDAAAAEAGTTAAAAEEGFGSPPAAAGGGGGFGFTFPTTPPSAVDAAVHEERAERVFSTWASNHSHSLSGALDFEVAAGGEDSEADTSSSKPPPADSTAAAAPAEAATNSSSPDGPDQITLVAPVVPMESPFLAGAALAACSKSSSPAGKAASRGGSRAQSSSSAAARAAAAGGSSRSSSRRLSAAGRQQQQQQQQQASAPASSSGGARSPLGDDGAAVGSGAQGSGSLPQQGSAGYDALGNALIPALDADAESAGGLSGSGELMAPRYVVDEAGNLLYEYDAAYIENRYEMFDLRIIHRRRRTGFEDSKEFPIRKNDLIAGRYQVMDFLGSAAFSQAVQALDTATGALVCLKIIKNNKDYFDQSLDEIKLLRYVNNADPDDEHHIVRLYDFFYYKEHLILVCELLRANLYEFQKYQRENGDDPYFTPPRIQRIAVQVLQSLAFLHSLGLVHSDLKPENILIKSYSRCEVKVIDLGSSCFITDHLSSYVQSRSYRAPEVILGLPYGQKIDIWSLGCILAELATGYVLFQNDSLATLLARLEGILGPLPGWMVSQGRYSSRYYTRSRQLYERSKGNGRYELLLPKHTSLRYRVPAADEGFLDFLSYLLTLDPSARPSATEALQHPWLSFPYPPVEQIPD